MRSIWVCTRDFISDVKTCCGYLSVFHHPAHPALPRKELQASIRLPGMWQTVSWFAGGRQQLEFQIPVFFNLVRNPTQSSSCALAINHPFCINRAPSKKKTTKHQCLYHVLILKVRPRLLNGFRFLFPLEHTDCHQDHQSQTSLEPL